MTFLNAIDHWLNRSLTSGVDDGDGRPKPAAQSELPPASRQQDETAPMPRITPENLRAISAFMLGA